MGSARMSLAISLGGSTSEVFGFHPLYPPPLRPQADEEILLLEAIDQYGESGGEEIIELSDDVVVV